MENWGHADGRDYALDEIVEKQSGERNGQEVGEREQASGCGAAADVMVCQQLGTVRTQHQVCVDPALLIPRRSAWPRQSFLRLSGRI